VNVARQVTLCSLQCNIVDLLLSVVVVAVTSGEAWTGKGGVLLTEGCGVCCKQLEAGLIVWQARAGSC